MRAHADQASSHKVVRAPGRLSPARYASKCALARFRRTPCGQGLVECFGRPRGRLYWFAHRARPWPKGPDPDAPYQVVPQTPARQGAAPAVPSGTRLLAQLVRVWNALFLLVRHPTRRDGASIHNSTWRNEVHARPLRSLCVCGVPGSFPNCLRACPQVQAPSSQMVKSAVVGDDQSHGLKHPATPGEALCVDVLHRLWRQASVKRPDRKSCWLLIGVEQEGGSTRARGLRKPVMQKVNDVLNSCHLWGAAARHASAALWRMLHKPRTPR